MPIGGVIAAEGVIIPNAVGVDIGCGMAYTETNIPLEAIREIQTGNGTLIQAVIGDIVEKCSRGLCPITARNAALIPWIGHWKS